MELIVAVDQGGGIGLNGRLIYSLPEDLKRFKQITMGKTLVMGRGTFLSLPGQRPLTGRVNCVLSSRADEMQRRFPAGELGPFFFRSAEEFLAAHGSDDVICIGGGSVYRLFLPMCDTAYVTEIHDRREADTFFHLEGSWQCVQREEREGFDFCTYQRR